MNQQAGTGIHSVIEIIKTDIHAVTAIIKEKRYI